MKAVTEELENQLFPEAQIGSIMHKQNEMLKCFSKLKSLTSRCNVNTT